MLPSFERRPCATAGFPEAQYLSRRARPSGSNEDGRYELQYSYWSELFLLPSFFGQSRADVLSSGRVNHKLVGRRKDGKKMDDHGATLYRFVMAVGAGGSVVDEWIAREEYRGAVSGAVQSR